MDSLLKVAEQRLLVPGRNCWRIDRAQRLAFLVDGDAYFRAVRAAIAQAKRSVFILGWDIDSRMRLVPGGANDGLPEELGEFLNAVVKRQKHLRMCVLSWDFAMVFAMDREWMPLYKLDWLTHRRLSFRLDEKHPMGASHHQKVVVVDDAVAFVGGLDLTHGRWDTPAHACNEKGRCDPDGKAYRPFHDVQAIVDGGPARALGELCRDRWQRATGRKARPLNAVAEHDPWPSHVEPELTDVDVAVARTDPGYVTGHPIEEIRHLYVDAIAAARRSMYLENQYFSSSVVGAAMATRLRRPDAPDVLVVSRRTEEGWLEERTMGVLRSRLHKELKAADVGGHYGLYYPDVPNLAPPNLLNVHSKVLIVDDELCSVGSANFSNRSMGFDTECNIAIDAQGDPRIQRAIAGLRNRLLGEHLGVEPPVVAAATAQHEGRLIRTVESLRREGRTLEPINPEVSPEIDALIPASAVVDPERPVDPEELVSEFVPTEVRRPAAGRVTRITVALVMMAAVAALWRWTPLREWVSLQSLIAMARTLEDSPIAPLVVLSGYVAAGLLVVPVTLLIIVTGVVFGPLLGGVYALAGALLSASVTYWIGRVLGRNSVRRLAGRKLNRITRELARKGIFAIAIIRLLPIAPFSLVNVVIGASHIGLRDFLLGTAFGMAPGIALTVIFVDRVTAAVTDPGLGTFAAVAALAAVLLAVAVYVKRHFGRTPAVVAREV